MCVQEEQFGPLGVICPAGEGADDSASCLIIQQGAFTWFLNASVLNLSKPLNAVWKQHMAVAVAKGEKVLYQAKNK